jgi:hypothetical protein
MGSLPPGRKVQLMAELHARLACLAAAAVADVARAVRRRVLDSQHLGPARAQVPARERHGRGVVLLEENALAGNPVPALLVVIAAFATCGIEYFIGGSVASSVYGLYRATVDGEHMG